jgi:sulfide:quinone oxidoreductase
MTPLSHPDEGPLGVLIAGAGIAGLETLVALRGLARHEVAPTLIAPDETFSLRALSVFEPFGYEQARRYPLPELTGALDAGRRQDAVSSVDRARREVTLRSGAVVPYDVLVVAVGAVPYPAFDHGVLFDYARNRDRIDATLRDVHAGRVDSVAVVVPPRSAWTLPAYELAFMLSSSGRQPASPAAGAGAPRAGAPSVTLVTAEPEPLAVFGPPAAAMIRAEFAASGIELVCGATAQVPSDRIVELSHGRRLRASRVIHLPGAAGPRIPGIPCGPDGFILVDGDLRVDDDPDVFAIGDGTAGGLKNGGLAALQADAVARQIAQRAGASVAVKAFRPALRAVLRTERGPRYLRADPGAGDRHCTVSDEPLWWPPSKVVSQWLVPWLAVTDLEGRPASPAA